MDQSCATYPMPSTNPTPISAHMSEIAASAPRVRGSATHSDLVVNSAGADVCGGRRGNRGHDGSCGARELSDRSRLPDVHAPTMTVTTSITATRLRK